MWIDWSIARARKSITSGAERFSAVTWRRKIWADKLSEPAGLRRGELPALHIDPVTNLVVNTVDNAHPVETLAQNYAHEVDLANYAVSIGMNVPMQVSEKVGGSTIWRVQLTSISFNVGPTDANFVVQ